MKKSVDPIVRAFSPIPRRPLMRMATLASIAGGLMLAPAQAASLYWDTNGSGTDSGYGGDGTWNTSNLFWNTSATIGSGSLQAWNNAASPLDDANFLRGTSGNVTVNATQTLRSLTFGSSAGSFTAGSAAYSVTGGILDIRQASSSTGLSNLNGSVTTIDSTIHLFGAVASGAENNRQRINNGSGTLTLGNIHNIAGFSGAGNQTVSLESFGAAISINGNMTKAAAAKGMVLDIGGASTSNTAIYTLGGNNSGLGGTATLNRGTLVLNNSNALVGSSGLTVANVNAGSADTAQVLTGTSGVTVNKAITFSTLGTDTTDVRIIGGNQTSGTSTFSGGITLGAFAASGSGSSLQITSAAGGTVVFSNNISDGANTVPITKVGDGVVIFSRAAGNNYDGGTTVTAGTLLINNTSGSGAGTGAVAVAAGTLGGNGSVSGAVTIGNGVGSGDAAIAAGNSVGTFTTASTLSFLSDAAFVFELDSTLGTADQLVANGVTINGSSVFSFTDLGAGALTLNTQFIIISNTSGSAINGAFGNLADGSTFTQGANQYQVNYAGGDGNDLTLTVIPEPSSALLTGFGLLVAVRLARRSGRHSNS
jgi:autotransporter-associated beta strand protein